MVETISAKDVTLKQLKTIFDLKLAEDNHFFREWQDNLPEITNLPKQMLDRVKAGYFTALFMLIDYVVPLKKPIKPMLLL